MKDLISLSNDELVEMYLTAAVVYASGFRNDDLHKKDDRRVNNAGKRIADAYRELRRRGARRATGPVAHLSPS